MKRRRFLFQPTQLTVAARDLREKFPHDPAEFFTARASRAVFETLAARIVNIGDQDLSQFANNLTLNELLALARGLPTLDDQSPAGLEDKITRILLARPGRGVAHLVWDGLQKNPDHSALPRILARCLNNDDQLTGALGASPEAARVFYQGIRRGSPLRMWPPFILRAPGSFQQAISSLGVSENHELFIRLAVAVLTRARRAYLSRQSPDQLKDLFSRITIADAWVLAERYLSTLKLTDYHEAVMLELRRILGHPDDKERDPRWDNISQRARKDFRGWFMRYQLENFFSGRHADPARLTFWQNQVGRFGDLKIISTPPIIFIYLSRYVIVEFGLRGNAAYIYEKHIFEEHFAPYADGTHPIKSEGNLKDRTLKRSRIIHSGRWQSRTIWNLRSWLR